LKTIKERGGLTLAQAEHDNTAMSGMPQSATSTGLVDAVMPVEDMPAKLLDYQRHLLKVASKKAGDGTRFDAGEHLAKISSLLRARVGHDFSKYKDKTMVRRIQRRMQVLQIDTVPAYAARERGPSTDRFTVPGAAHRRHAVLPRPLTTALQNSALIGLIGAKLSAAPPSVATAIVA
jgi:hypothetical protein